MGPRSTHAIAQAAQPRPARRAVDEIGAVLTDATPPEVPADTAARTTLLLLGVPPGRATGLAVRASADD